MTAINQLLNKVEWHEERKTLRSLALSCDLEESVKWGKLCFSLNGNNIAIIYGLKGYCALGFFKGALLKDDDGVLIAPGAHSQAMRQLRFTGLKEIKDREDQIVRFLQKAIQAERDGLKVVFREKETLSYSDELQDRLDDDPEFAAAFDALTHGRKRGYLLHFSGAKQAKTRIARIDKARERVLAGKGITDR
ncbi:YdeI/OmpD-associated family protein [uncultured Nisaea sp.]|uniref:YdeI/OmpD-associated family protein n=1 Tax=uncultured Nisaea sp. TaxID=538215 RepID=UPI0030EF0C18|tara:strand:- start:1601 stop:2176 length:576 start_codon:yes stop_codon:yes gene_type:complete